VRESQDQDVARLFALVHDKKQTLSPIRVKVQNIWKRFRYLMCESLVECCELCHFCTRF